MNRLVQHGNGSPIIIRRVDCQHVHEWARKNCCLRDYLFIRLPMKMGLRTSEIATLRIENIDFEKRRLAILDSKKYALFSLPADPITLQLLKDYIGDRREGLVFLHKKDWQPWEGLPLSKVAIWKYVKRAARLSGVRGWKEFTPRLYRHYFAAWWNYEDEKIKKKRGNLELLRQMLRHKDLGMTQIYLSRLVFFEDLQREYDKVQGGPFFAEMEVSVETEMEIAVGKPTPETICSDCERLPICKYAPLPPCALNCQYKIALPPGAMQKRDVSAKATLNNKIQV